MLVLQQKRMPAEREAELHSQWGGVAPSATQQQHVNMSSAELVSQLAAFEKRMTEQHTRRERAARLASMDG